MGSTPRLAAAAAACWLAAWPAPAPALTAAPGDAVARCGRLRADARAIVCADGSPFTWRGVTAFRLPDLVADGREPEAVAFLDWAAAAGFTVVRVLSTLCCWFDLPPDEGAAALPRVLALAASRGLYVQVVALAGTAERAVDLDAHVAGVGEIARRHANAVVEVANEVAHPSQDPRLADGGFALAEALGRALPPEVLYTVGSGPHDDWPGAPLGEFVTRHVARTSDKWDLVRGVDRLDALARRLGRPVLSGEPVGADEAIEEGRREVDADVFFAYGAACGLFALACNFHLEAGLDARPPGPRQDEAARAFVAGSRLVADVNRLDPAPLLEPGSPVAAARLERAAGLVAAMAGNGGFVLAFGLTGDLEIGWADGWRAEPIANRPAVRVWRVVSMRVD